MDALHNSRKLRAVGLVAVSFVVAGVVVAIYGAPDLKPSTHYAPVPTPSPVETAQGQRATYDFLTPSLGWAAIQSQGSADVWVFRTTDGAKTWRQSAVIHGLAVAEVQLLQFFDRSNGYLQAGGFIAVTAVSAEPDFRLYRTRDGGVTWIATRSPDPQVATFAFSDPLHGWATAATDSGSRLFATADGGVSWSRLPDLPAGGTPVFRSPTEGWMSGDPSTAPQEVFSSADGGYSWTPHVLPQPLAGMARGGSPQAGGYAGLTGLTLLPGSGVLVNVEQPCFSKQQCSQSSPLAYTTFDRGTTWNPVSAPPGGDFAAVSYQDGHHWWVIQSNSLWKTADAGQTWKLISDRVIYDHLLPTIIDGDHAWVQILLTDDTHPGRPQSAWELDMTGDGGVRWNQVSVPVAR